MQNRGIHGPLIYYEKEALALTDELLSCQLPRNNPRLRKIVEEVQKHAHTKSCLKYDGTCRYKYPKLPSPKTLLTEPLPSDMDPEEKAELLSKVKLTLQKAKSFLERSNIDENITFEEFLLEISVTKDEYMKHISISEHGKVLVLKRDVSERSINNFNPEWLEAWDANMDIQLALDPFAVITYIVSYVSKDESGMTGFLKQALKENANAEMLEKLRALKMKYLTHREMGVSEAVYKINPGMRLKDSNIACIFVNSGFPDNRSVFYHKVKDADEEEMLDDVDSDSETEERDENNFAFKIEGRQGRYKQAISIHDRYSGRPERLEEMCLAQFATCYTYTSKPPKKTTLDKDGNSEEQSDQVIFNQSIKLPRYIALTPKTLGFMRLRWFPACLRIHSSKRKEGHEQHYSELLLFAHWRDEIMEFCRDDADACVSIYVERKSEISRNRTSMYPGEATIELMEDEDFQKQKPTHIFDAIASQAEQENKDDLEEGLHDAPEYESLACPEQFAYQEEGGNFEDFKYKKICLPNDEDLKIITLRLVPEQMDVLYKVMTYCKTVVKSWSNPRVKVKPIRLIVHGGAGNTFIRHCKNLKQYF